MEYGMLLSAHANARYQQAIGPLSRAELMLIMSAANIRGEARYRRFADLDWLCFSSTELEPTQIAALQDHSQLYLLAEILPGEIVRPLFSKREPYLGGDLPGILKYKGKTNETFTHLLNNLALYSGAFSNVPRHEISYYDPLCGRGTSLFDAVNRGWNATGADMDAADIKEATGFFKRYLEYHRVKHTTRDDSLSHQGGKSFPRKSFVFSDTPEHYKAGERVTLSLVRGDTAEVTRALGKKPQFHLITADLPYGVQHAPGESTKPASFDSMLERSLLSWREKLMPGGAIALSFNVNTLMPAKLRRLMIDAGLVPLCGGAYDGLEHWVEQAVTRDIVVGLRHK